MVAHGTEPLVPADYKLKPVLTTEFIGSFVLYLLRESEHTFTFVTEDLPLQHPHLVLAPSAVGEEWGVLFLVYDLIILIASSTDVKTPSKCFSRTVIF